MYRLYNEDEGLWNVHDWGRSLRMYIFDDPESELYNQLVPECAGVPFPIGSSRAVQCNCQIWGMEVSVLFGQFTFNPSVLTRRWIRQADFSFQDTSTPEVWNMKIWFQLSGYQQTWNLKLHFVKIEQRNLQYPFQFPNGQEVGKCLLSFSGRKPGFSSFVVYSIPAERHFQGSGAGTQL